MREVYYKYFKTFFEFYKMKISPKFGDIDIYLKNEEELDIKEISELLYITEEEIKNLMKLRKIKKINRDNFLEIMINGSSYICQLYRREVECGCPDTYTSNQISYIYDLDNLVVEKIFDKLHLKKINQNMLPEILERISVSYE
ncbi:MAG: hypothetical protein FWF57_05845 [Defluviitaleaceae bacterium]|nr:hypothetical protein [Defluviitaleaceae bacterium]